MISRLLSFQIFSLADDGRLFGLDYQLLFDSFITAFNLLFIWILIGAVNITILVLFIVYITKYYNLKKKYNSLKEEDDKLNKIDNRQD